MKKNQVEMLGIKITGVPGGKKKKKKKIKKKKKYLSKI